MPLISPSVGSSGLSVAAGTPTVIDPRPSTPALFPGGSFGVAAGTPGIIAILPPAPPAPPRPVPPPVIPSPGFTSVGGGGGVAEAILVRWNSRVNLVSLVPGGLWTGEAPSTVVAMPYAVLTQVSDVSKDRTTGFRIYAGTYQISVMADDLAEAEAICKAVADAYDEAALPLDGFMSCFAGDVRWTLGVGLGLGGEDCWTCYVELEISYTR